MIEKQRILDGLQNHIKTLKVELDRLQRVKAPSVAFMEKNADIRAFERVFKSIERMENK